ncbi:MAG: hypothetical protein JNK82_23950 [Myxococcaceae bacterium]|nr:hypothetical protein [Myxococcaceae bacterium]
MSQGHDVHIPKPVLLGAAVLMVSSLALAGTARVWRDTAPRPVPLEQYEVSFEDRSDGAVVMFDAKTGREVKVLAPGGSGFVRGVLRGMFRQRKLESLGREARFLLAREADGQLSLEDPQTGRRVTLDVFGPTNTEAFAELLAALRQERS